LLTVNYYCFLFVQQQVTFAEMTKEQKNSVSHRSLAIQKMREYFEANPDALLSKSDSSE
jgi:inosine/xanthosine triphosphate pyrophosphatase family protein